MSKLKQVRRETKVTAQQKHLLGALLYCRLLSAGCSAASAAAAAVGATPLASPTPWGACLLLGCASRCASAE